MPITDEIKEILADQQKASEDARKGILDAHKELDGRVGKIDDELKRHGSEFVETKTAFQDQVDRVARAESDLEDLSKKLSNIQMHGFGDPDSESYAEKAAASEAAKTYRGGNALLVEHEGSAFERKSVTSGGASAGPLIEPFRRPGVMLDPGRPLTVRDLLTVVPISTNSVEWVKELVFTNTAQVQENEGDVKGESNITFEKDTASVETIAHWIPMSRQVLADAPALQGIIETKMRYGLALVEEDQLISGNGLNGNLSGILPNSTAYDTNLNVVGDSGVDKLRHALLQATLSYYPADSLVLDHSEWEKIELTKTDDKAYLFTNPVEGAAPRLWGKRVVPSFAMPADTFLAGGFSMGATLWDRETVTVRIAEQHADFFVRNMVAMLVEERVCITVERPAAFITGTMSTA